MRTMDHGQLQKLLAATSATPPPPMPQNPLMLFSPMTSSQTPILPTSWPLKSPSIVAPSATIQNNVTDANLAAFILIQQALQNQQAAAASIPTLPIPTSTPTTSLLPNFSLPTLYQSTVPPPTVPPAATSPPAVFNALSSLLQMQTSVPTASIKPVEPVAIRKISLPADFVAVVPTPTGSASLPASSPSTSSKKGEEDEDEEEEEFVDIESVDVAIDGKEKRKAHVEFYRRMKYMRQHHREKALQCAVCKSKVENHENAMAVHVAEHADAGCYQCRLCGWQAIDKYKIYFHMRSEHPRKVDMFVDKRDMPKMCLALSQCFPKTTARPKKESNRSADTYLSEILRTGDMFGDRTCDVCKGKVRCDKGAMIRHVQTNHTIKCKTCKTISSTLEDQLIHQEQSHKLKAPKMSVHYAPSAAAVYLLPALEKCFPNNNNVISK